MRRITSHRNHPPASAAIAATFSGTSSAANGVPELNPASPAEILTDAVPASERRTTARCNSSAPVVTARRLRVRQRRVAAPAVC